jgi:chromosome segregation protein
MDKENMPDAENNEGQEEITGTGSYTTAFLQPGKKGKLRAEKLIIRNFKSFRKADLPFSKGFSSIVGANGSGKSNILDAIMFVLGATSLKAMRVSRLSELINHDAEDASARVEILLNLGGEEFRVARRIDKGGKSIYRLNDRRVSLNEVGAFLGGLGIRADGHNIVAQGDITKITDMSPKQRREIIDEIAGIREYEEKKDEALKKLEKVEKKISDIRIVIGERQAYLGQVEKEMEAALRYNELQDEAKQTKATVIAEEIKAIKNSISEREKKIGLLEKETEAARKEREALKSEEAGLEKRNSEITERIISAGEQTYSQIGKSVEETRASVRIEEEKLRNSEERMLGAKKEGSEKALRVKELENTKAAGNERLRVISTRLAEIGDVLRPLESKKEEMKSAFEKLYSELKVNEGRLSEADEKAEAGKKALFEKESQLRERRKELHVIREELKSLNENTERLGISSRKKRVELFLDKLNAVISLAEELKGKLDSKAAAKLAELSNVTKELAAETEQMKDNLSELAGEKKAAQYAQRIKDISRAAEADEKEVTTLQDTLRRAENGKIAAKEPVQQIKKSISALIAKQAGQQQEKLIAERDRLKEESTRLGAEIGNAAGRIKELASESGNALQLTAEEEKNISGRKSSIEKLRQELKEKEAELEKSSAASKVLEEERKRLLTKISNIGEKVEQLASKVEQKERAINEINLESSKNEVRLSDLEQEFEEYREIKRIEGKSLPSLKSRIIEIEKEIKGLGAINMKAPEDFEGIRSEVAEVEEKANKLEEEKNAVVDLITKTENRKTNVFMGCFSRIAAKFSEMYYDFFEGEGYLQLSSPENPFEGGLLIQAKYSGDRMKSIDAMSGGEKTLTALAFMFAIQDYEAAPFYILDEADAALDVNNSAKFVKLIADHAKKTQFIVITHNDTITKECDQIIGVAMNKQKSSVIGLRLKGKISGDAGEAAN